MPIGTAIIDGVRIGFQPATDAETAFREQHPWIYWGVMITEVTAPDAGTACRRAVEGMEPVFESLSFQLQTPLQISGIDATDITPPISIGEEREFGRFSGYPLKHFRPASVQTTGVLTQPIPGIVRLPALDRRHHAALHWYLKALAAPFEVDQFIFLWIAFEIFSDRSEIRDEAPLILRCQHEIGECPTCRQPTTRVVQGATRQRYLTEAFGVDADVAGELWRARNILHGAEEFDSAVMDRLPELSQVLRAVVNAALKDALGFARDTTPIVQYGHAAASPNMGVGGTHRIEQQDLDWPEPSP